MKCKAIISFNAYGIQARTGQELTIEDKGVRLDLEKLGWIEPIEYRVSEDMNVKEAKKATKKTEKE